MELYEKTLSSQKVFQGRIVTLEVDQVELAGGETVSREVVRHGGGVCVLALDEADNLLLVRQYRYPYGQPLLELPAGKLERGEDPAACGRRELEEETGRQAGSFEPLGKLYPSPAYLDEVIHLYLARDLRRTRQNLDEGEYLQVESLPFSQAVELCLTGEILDSKTQVAILKYSEMRRRNGRL